MSTENPCIPPCNSNITASCFFRLDVIHSLFYFYFFSRGYWCNCDLPKSEDIFFYPSLSEFPPLTSQLNPLQPWPFFKNKRTPQHTRCWDRIMCRDPLALTMIEPQGPSPQIYSHSTLMISLIHSRAIHQLFEVPFFPGTNKTGQHVFQEELSLPTLAQQFRSCKTSTKAGLIQPFTSFTFHTDVISK